MRILLQQHTPNCVCDVHVRVYACTCIIYVYCPAYIVHRVAHGTRKFFPQGRVDLPKVFAVVPAQEMGHERGAEGRGADLDARPPLDGAGNEGIPA